MVTIVGTFVTQLAGQAELLDVELLVVVLATAAQVTRGSLSEMPLHRIQPRHVNDGYNKSLIDRSAFLVE